MALPLIILAIFSIFYGFLTKDLFIGLGTGFFLDNALFVHPAHEIVLDTEFAIPLLFKLLPFFLTIFLSMVSIIFSEYYTKSIIQFKYTNLGYNIFSLFNQRFFIELFYNKFISGIILKLGGQTTKFLDRGSVEYLGPYGLEIGLIYISKNISKLDSGVITSYALYILSGLIFYIFIWNNIILDEILIMIIFFGLLYLLKTKA